ncbi:MAG: DUF222 domain-containing protein, partial [Rhodococcus sp. (in: high G+C Gram-positive bacteria)]
MLSGEGVAGLADDLGVASARGGLAISDPTLCEAVEAMEAAWNRVAAVDSSLLVDADRRAVMVRMETLSRAMYGTSHTWLTELVENDGLAVLPERTNPSRLGCLLRVDPLVAGKRIKIAAKLSRRRAMTGEKLDPEYPTTADGHRGGEIDAAHVKVIDKFFKNLPSAVDHESKVQSEILLGNLAKEVTPEQLRVAAARLHALLDPDGTLDEKDPSSKCYFRLGPQDSDGLSKGSFVIDAECRAYLEPLLAKLAKPGNCNPDEPKPVVDEPEDSDKRDGSDKPGGRDEPGPGDETDSDPTLFDGPGSGSGGGGSGGPGSGGGGSDSTPGDHDPRDTSTAEGDERRAGRDGRSQGRRNHDAFKVILRQMLASGSVGRHRGLPVTAIITMTAKELETASGHAVTGTGSLVTIRDAIRMASHAHHYLAIFDDDGRALYLGRSKRIASADQRIVLIARDRGCSFPGCTRPAVWCQAHHVTDWVDGGDTDVDSLTFGCD